MIKVKNMTAYIFVMGFCLLSFTCNSPTGPGQIVQPGRRDYVWTVDTIYSVDNLFSTIYGATPNNVWLGGHGGPPNERLWHYDGSNWKQVPSPEGCNANSIFGFSANDIWLGSYAGKIFHYDGTNWNQNFVYGPPNSDPIITEIYGTSPTDIYAIGSLAFYNSDTTGRGFILHYFGGGWREEYVAAIQGLNFGDFMLQEGSKVFFVGWDTQDTEVIFQYSNSRLLEIIKSSADIGLIHMALLGGKVYFLLGKDLSRYVDGNFEKIVTLDINISNIGYQLYGRNLKDIFLIVGDGIEHYNGDNIQYLYRLPTTSPFIYARSLIFENDVFFVLNYTDPSNFSKTLILHGKLTK